jgi:hypothetical protein
LSTIIMFILHLKEGLFQYHSQCRFGYCSVTPRIYFLAFNVWFRRSLWYAGFIFSETLSKFYSIQFRPLFSRLGQNYSFIWEQYAADHGMVLIWYRTECSMFTAVCIPSFGMDRNCTVHWSKYSVALNPGLGGVGRYWPWTYSIKPSLQYFHICFVRWISKFPFHLFLFSSKTLISIFLRNDAQNWQLHTSIIDPFFYAK